MNVAVVCFVLSFRMQGRCRAGKLKTFHRLPFSLLLASNCFPRAVASYSCLQGEKNVPQQVCKTCCNSAYAKLRESAVCRKCCCKLINKSAVVL